MAKPLRLILTRHAKSSWRNPALEDFARPLNRRGRRAADLLGAQIAADGLCPAQVLHSTATRARETWERIAPHCPDADAQGLDALYLASPEEMRAALRREARARVVMLVGHNPGIGALAQGLAAAPPPHPAFSRYITGATTVLDLDIPSWEDLGPASRGRVVAFLSPRDLERTRRQE